MAQPFVVLKLKTPGHIVAHRIGERLGRFPRLTRSAINTWGKRLAQEMTIVAKNRGIRDFENGLLKGKIQWRQARTGDVGQLVMPIYGFYLDRMRPHYISVSKSTPLRLRWALQSDNYAERARAVQLGVSKGGIKRFSVKVVPHPYIRQAYSNVRGLLPTMIKTEFVKTKAGYSVARGGI